MYSMLTILNYTVLYSRNLLRVDLKHSPISKNKPNQKIGRSKQTFL